MTYASEVLADSPVLWWRLGDASGATATDSSGNGRHGTYSGSPTLGAAGLVTGSDTAVQFDGTDDYVSYSGTVLASSNQSTVECWIKTTPNSIRYAYHLTGTSSLQWLQLNATTGGDIIVDPTGSSTPEIANIPGLMDGNRHHVVSTWDNATDTMKVYIDGALYNSVVLTGGTIAISSVYVGQRNGAGGFFLGTIDEFAIYGTELTSTRIAAHYAAGSIAPITIHPAKITSTGTVRAPAIVPYVAPVDGNITITAELAPARWSAAVTESDRSAEIQPARHTAGVQP